MRNSPSTSTEPVHNFPYDEAQEHLWQEVFQDEYKPNAMINFQKIKDFLVKKNTEDDWWKMRDYNYKIMNPEALCDMFIENPPQSWTISFLESLDKNTKKCLADLLLETTPLTKIKEMFGMAMVFWIRCYAYCYSNKRKQIQDFLLQDSSLIKTEEDYMLLEKTYMSSRQLHRKDFSAGSTIHFFFMACNLSKTITSPTIQSVLHTQLDTSFSLETLHTRKEYTFGKENIWYGRDLDKNNQDIDPENFSSVSHYQKNENEDTIEVANRASKHIYKDRSGRMYKIYLDGPIGISLCHNGLPVALISFSGIGNTLFIHQMQTVVSQHYDRFGRAQSENVDPIVQTIPWQKVLYEILLSIGKQYGYDTIGIQGSTNNKRTEKPRKILDYNDHKHRREEVETDSPHLSLSIAEKIYDLFADKQGFTQDETNKNRYKFI